MNYLEAQKHFVPFWNAIATAIPTTPTGLPGVYVIFNKVSRRFYIGQSRDIAARWVHHRARLRCGKHHNIALQADWSAQQETDFVFSVFVQHKTAQVAVNIERELVERNSPICYNRPKHTKETWRAKFPVGFGRGRPDLPRRRVESPTASA